MEGTFCEEGTEGPTGAGLCPTGYYCPYDAPEPIPADEGYFAAGEGNVKQEACAPGTYTYYYKI
jgi:hypothetical protein